MSLFEVAKPVIGMIHLPALPGAPGHHLSLAGIVEAALRDGDSLSSGGVDAIMLENFGDVPFFPGGVPAHTVAAMTVVAHEVKRRFQLPLGINVLRNDGLSALGIAVAVSAQFIRINVFTGARLADQGILQGDAHNVQRMRKLLGAQVEIFADVAVKHSAPLGPRSLEDEVEDTVRRAGADAIIVSGTGTGKHTNLDELRCAKTAAGRAPVLIGSGASAETLSDLLRYADGLIVGTAFKRDTVTTNPVDPERVRTFMRAMSMARGPVAP